MKTSEIYLRAMARIATEGQWCQYSYAKNQKHDDLHPRNPDATQRCAVGAIVKEGGRAVLGVGLRSLNDQGGLIPVLEEMTQRVIEMQKRGE